MREIRYYDRINKQYVNLEVTDEVAKFLMSSEKQIQRSKNRYNYFTVSIDDVVYQGDGEDDDLTYEDILAEPEEETTNCKTCKERLDFYNIIWNAVAKLDKEKYDLIWDIFVEKKKQKQIAKELGKNEELIS